LKKENDIINLMSDVHEGGKYTLAHNRFSTMTDEEFKRFLGKKPELQKEKREPKRIDDTHP